MKKYPNWVRKHKRKGTAIHKIGKNFYLYEITSKWDKDLKRAKKITKGYLGIITPDGLKEPAYKRNSPTTFKEYGASYLLMNQNKDILSGLKECFPYWWKEIFVLSALRFMHKSPLKNMRFYYEGSFLSEEIKDVSLHEKALLNIFKEIGGDRGSIVRFLRTFISDGENLLIDLTNVFTLSSNIVFAENGYNGEFDFTPQVNVLFMFSFSNKLPLFYRVLPGNVRDVNTLKSTIYESGIKDVIIIGDKGFYSEDNIELLNRSEIKYILPLKRNSLLIDYGLMNNLDKREFESYFKFNKRYIWYYKSKTNKGSKIPVWVYLDERLRVSEQEDYLTRIETHPELGYTKEGFYQQMSRFGTIALITNLKELSPEVVFQYFKSRYQIEVMFDTFKNILESDRTYMRTDRAMETWMFINYLALTYYYKIYHLLIKHNFLKEYSVLDVVLYLSKFCKVKISNHWIDIEIPKQTRNLIEKLGLHIT